MSVVEFLTQNEVI